MARRQTPFVKTAMSDADKSKDKGKSKVVVQDSGATDEESDVEEADSVNFEKARYVSLPLHLISNCISVLKRDLTGKHPLPTLLPPTLAMVVLDCMAMKICRLSKLKRKSGL